jgi:hypothetical protein
VPAYDEVSSSSHYLPQTVIEASPSLTEVVRPPFALIDKEQPPANEHVMFDEELEIDKAFVIV